MPLFRIRIPTPELQNKKSKPSRYVRDKRPTSLPPSCPQAVRSRAACPPTSRADSARWSRDRRAPSSREPLRCWRRGSPGASRNTSDAASPKGAERMSSERCTPLASTKTTVPLLGVTSSNVETRARPPSRCAHWRTVRLSPQESTSRLANGPARASAGTLPSYTKAQKFTACPPTKTRSRSRSDSFAKIGRMST